MIGADEFRRRKQALVRTYATSSDAIGLYQSALTLLPLAALCSLAVWGLANSLLVTLAAAVGITLMLLRVFVMMHECGHGALFASRVLNRGFGFVYGVICGMPQYVWSKHHDFHHATNGNWDKYRGPLSTLSTDEYAALSDSQKSCYRRTRHIAFAPLAGFVYLIFNPRVNWLIGNAALLGHVLRGRALAAFETRRWKTWREYRHQTANNIALLGSWALLSELVGAGAFFALYLPTLSLAGGVGIVLFTVQHNFAESYAAPNATWDHDKGALEGSSFLVLPRWLNWVTANIGYHHVHHLSAAIPNHRLVACHEANADLFESVPRLTLRDVPAALRCVLWCRTTERIVTCAEYERAAALKSTPSQALAS